MTQSPEARKEARTNGLLFGGVALHHLIVVTLAASDAYPVPLVLLLHDLAAAVSLAGVLLILAGRVRAGVVLAIMGCIPFLPVGLIAAAGALQVLRAERSDADQGRTPGQLAFRRFRKNKRAIVSALVLSALLHTTILIPVIAPHGFDQQHYKHVQEKPGSGAGGLSCELCREHDQEKGSGNFLMGTDSVGRDLMVRAFMGGRISFAVGLLATAVSVIIGIAYGSVSAFAGGKTDLVMMRIVDVLYGLPYMFIVIIAMAIFESRSFLLVFLVLGAFGWLTMSRIVRGQILSLKEREFVEAAKALGVRTPSIIWRHMIPNILGPVIVYATLTVPSIMLSEAFLSFLGLGISEPNTSWGVLINEGANALNPIKVSWWLVTFPGAMLAVTLYCLNSVGDGLRDAFDVQQRG